jgi:TIR domain/Pentapeptide repeats (8 copies)
MADESQVAMLKRSVEEWNEWRQRRSWRVTIDPRALGAVNEVDLSGANLAGTTLAGAILVGANLEGADLRGANASWAKFDGANLREAKLNGAQLSSATFGWSVVQGQSQSHITSRHADLQKASLAETGLHWAVFDACVLGDTDVSRATIAKTYFLGVDLSGMCGLETCEYLTRSSVDYDTLLLSGNVPLAFARGVGLPDRWIEYLPSLVGNPIDFHSVFVSYSTVDKDFADRLHADLQNNGVRCWFAPHDMTGGKKLHEQIDEAIRLYDRLLLILSEASMASNWVRDEIRRARRKEQQLGRRVLFPVSLVPFDPVLKDWEFYDMTTGENLAEEVRAFYVPDFTGWGTDHARYKAAFDKLLKGLKAEEQPTDTTVPDE